MNTFNTINIQQSNLSFIVNDALRAKSEYICKLFPSVEWCGYLLYKIKSGSLKEGNLVLEGIDLIPMGIGSSAYTEFESDDTLDNYLFDNDLFDEEIFIGIIHSHNNMSTYYSGTDQNTLKEFASKYTHFLSVITNNKGEIIAAITSKNKEIHNTIVKTEVDTFNGKSFKKEDREYSKESSSYEYYYLNVTQQEPNLNTDFSFIDTKIEELKETLNNSKYTSEFSSSSKYHRFRDYTDYEDYIDCRKKRIPIPVYTGPNPSLLQNFLYKFLSMSIMGNGYVSEQYISMTLPMNIEKTFGEDLDLFYDIASDTLDTLLKIYPEYVDILEEAYERLEYFTSKSRSSNYYIYYYSNLLLEKINKLQDEDDELILGDIEEEDTEIYGFGLEEYTEY